jgi:outer membrane protein OmpA-like peptidoglycan-associated protein
MRILIVAIALAGTVHAGLVLAQRRPATEAEAQSYITSAFLSQADPGAMSPNVALGPELEQALGLQSGTDRVKVYQAVVPLTGEQRLEVRRATTAEISDYGMRRGLDRTSPHPLFTVEAGGTKLLLQYDLQALNIVYVGRLGLPDPDPRPVVQAAAAPAAAGKKADLINVAWTAEFPYNSARLTPDMRAKLDSEVVPKLIASKDIKYLNVYGHADRLGAPEYNRQLSEKRAEAVRAYLVSRGMDGSKIQSQGYGKTSPVKACPAQTDRKALIACLGPNRRVEIEISGTRS